MTDENIPVESLENEGTDTQPHAVFDDAITHHLRGMYRSWYLEYASYVILERAVPHIDDGLKPVQRRILHSMQTLDDGRFNKVANIVGNTMQYHPHVMPQSMMPWYSLARKRFWLKRKGTGEMS